MRCRHVGLAEVCSLSFRSCSTAHVALRGTAYLLRRRGRAAREVEPAVKLPRCPTVQTTQLLFDFLSSAAAILACHLHACSDSFCPGTLHPPPCIDAHVQSLLLTTRSASPGSRGRCRSAFGAADAGLATTLSALFGTQAGPNTGLGFRVCSPRFEVAGCQDNALTNSRPARQLQYFGFALTPLLHIGDGAVTWALKLNPGRMVGAAVSLFSPSPASGWPDLATSPSPAPRTPLRLGFRACAETLNLKLLSFLCPGCPTSFSALATSR